MPSGFVPGQSSGYVPGATSPVKERVPARTSTMPGGMGFWTIQEGVVTVARIHLQPSSRRTPGRYAVRLMRTAALVTLLQPHDAAIATGSMGPGVRRDDQWRMALQ